jgi:hypothetical protein
LDLTGVGEGVGREKKQQEGMKNKKIERKAKVEQRKKNSNNNKKL